MAKQLYRMSWQEVQSEMSIAGRPAEMVQLGRYLMALLIEGIDRTNRAELINAEFMLRRIMAEIKHMQKEYDASHNINV